MLETKKVDGRNRYLMPHIGKSSLGRNWNLLVRLAIPLYFYSKIYLHISSANLTANSEKNDAPAQGKK